MQNMLFLFQGRGIISKTYYSCYGGTFVKALAFRWFHPRLILGDVVSKGVFPYLSYVFQKTHITRVLIKYIIVDNCKKSPQKFFF